MSEEKKIPQEPAPKKADKAANKPVVVYIMILFIAAFLLMALSFLMHQRSNTEALGQLQNSVTAMQEVQATQEANIALQAQLAELQEELDKTTAAYDGQLKALVGDVEQQQLKLDALTNLYLLQQAYSSGNYEGSLEIIQFMEASGQTAYLIIDGAAEGTASDQLVFPEFWTAPADRFQQLKTAVEAYLTRSTP